ncbi:peptide deformylase [Streptomyces marinisediminis]|uniref:peptide deformylase n=1 Tax=Streptomyces TaxID=1883 RepID=UPI003A4C63DF
MGHLVNPRVVERGGAVVRGPEGCLSLPGLEAATQRADVVRVAGHRADGTPAEVRGTGFFARCLQHECDHLDGVVYADRLGGLRARRLRRAAARAGLAWPPGGR